MAFAFLFDAQFDPEYEGSEETTLAKEAGIVNRAFNEWFERFRREIVTRDASRADGGADEVEDRMSGRRSGPSTPTRACQQNGFTPVSISHFNPLQSLRNCQAFLPVTPPLSPGLAGDSRAHWQ
jgi:hypothetical protein